jgi:hypothetical protein
MYESKRTPGKKFGSIFAGKKYDEDHTEDGMHSESAEHEAKESPEFEKGEQEGSDEHEHNSHEGAEQEALNEEHPIVAEHGKAHKVVIQHDAKSGRHTVTSHHKDGHMHSVSHETPEEAHKEGRSLAGVPADGQDEKHDSPYHQGKAQAGASSEEDGFAMPDLA